MVLFVYGNELRGTHLFHWSFSPDWTQWCRATAVLYPCQLPCCQLDADLLHLPCHKPSCLKQSISWHEHCRLCPSPLRISHCTIIGDSPVLCLFQLLNTRVTQTLETKLVCHTPACLQTFSNSTESSHILLSLSLSTASCCSFSTQFELCLMHCSMVYRVFFVLCSWTSCKLNISDLGTDKR